MCGIAGLGKLGPPATPADIATVQRMMDAQVDWEPDDSGLYYDPSAILSARQLPILDLSEAGRQRMTNEDGAVWGTHNGEIYEFWELCAELYARGHRFCSHADTEVLVHGYEAWGIEGLLARLGGTFALSLWGRTTRRLVLARERLGKKPLYYARDARRLPFASELKALLAPAWSTVG